MEVTEVNEIELLSVGVDIGSSTSHLVFSKLLLRVDERSLNQRFIIEDRNIIYQGRIINTPLLNDNTVDTAKLIDFIKKEYKRARINPADVQTGAVIITGETAKKHNAKKIVEVLSHDAGNFVAATAGPNFESMIAAMGSGAKDRSEKYNKTILSCDIGGGTSNIAISVNGKIVSTACVSIGGRLIAFDSEENIRYITDPARKVMKHLGMEYQIGEQILKKDIDKIAKTFAQVLIEVITGRTNSVLTKKLMITNDLKYTSSIDEFMFSGGVAELIYGGNGNHNDMGQILSDKINLLTPKLASPVVEPLNKIRATVIGAGAHSLSISGSSGFMDDKLEFPITNVPVLKVDVEQSKLSVPHVVSTINSSFQRFDLKEGEEPVALYFKDPIRNSYPKVELFAKSIEAALPNSIKKKLPIILIFETDIACSVGNVIRRETELKTNLLTLDELDLREGDWIDIGKPLIGNQVFPVTVKSLVFNMVKNG
ncbi:MAG: ethanolamine ammonia-lyase reactivating factor EutA [Deltaproteobacteria bacterium]|nr:ethanolamine ammonia-lyase reactivating factor EutA [Deltaproteobacteria bacterium]